MWVEAESNKIGNLHLPMDLWHAMKAAYGVELRVPTAVRTRLLLTDYRHFTERPDDLKALLLQLRYRLGTAVVSEWCGDIDAGRWERFVSNVLEQHYDLAYERSFREHFPNVTEHLDTSELTDGEIVRQLLCPATSMPLTC